MKWRKYTIATTEEAEEAVIGALYALGIDSVEIEDKAPVSPEANRGLFGEVLPDPVEDDHLARISFFTDDTEYDEGTLLADLYAAIDALREFCDPGDGTVSISETEDGDWINNWKQYFHSFYVDDIHIVPSWEEDTAEEETAAMTVHIDPGTAFGTGAHESTQIAIRGLRKVIKEGDRVLDIGTGSGILGIIALKSGASFVFGTDIDEVAFPALADNLEKNGIEPATFGSLCGNVIESEEARAAVMSALPSGCEIVMANIIAEILAELTPYVPSFLAPGGYYITSGILREKEQLVRSAIEKAGLRYVKTIVQGDWCGIVAQK